jgi:hypothetical protein
MSNDKKLSSFMLLWAVLAVLSFFIKENKIFDYLLLAATPILLMLVIFHCLKIIRLLPPVNVKSPLFIVGLLIIVGGSLFDIITTVIICPTLESEANIFVTSMFAQGAPLFAIYAYNFLVQCLLILMGSLLWILFCKRLPVIIQKLPSKNVWYTYIQLCSGENATFKDFICSKIDPFYFNVSLAPFFIAGCIFRIYCGFEWLQLTPISRLYVPVALLFFANIFYVIYVDRKLKLKLKVA